MRVHFDKSKAAIGLKTSFQDVPEVLEQRDQVVLSGVRCQVTHVAGGLPLGSLLNNHVITLDAMSGKVVVTKGDCRGHSHGGHRLLLGDGRLTLLVGPVAPNGTRTQPFTIHRAQSLVSVLALTEGHEAVTTRASGLHIPHDTRFRDRAKGRKGLEQDLVVDFIAQISHEDVEMVRGILLVGAVGLVSPVDANFLRQLSARLYFFWGGRG